jgi:hypothetical protein
MTKSATRRAVPAGWLERVFSQGAQTKSLHHKPRASAAFGLAFLLFTGKLMSKGLQAFKQTDLLRAIKTFQKAGLPVARAEID